MTKAYMYLKKIVALAIVTAIFIISTRFNFPIYISIPVLVLAFSLVVSRITGSSPKELFNFQRSEKFFSKGGLRDLIRIPVVLFAFLQDVIVWALWGIYQVFELFIDTIYFIKELIFWILHAIIWFLKQLLPFWRIVYRMLIHYLIKWPWWIYRYSFRAVRKTFNWNVIKISLTGTFIALFIFQAFYFLDINFEIPGLVYIGVILALLPLSWIFGEISSLRGQKLLFANYKDVRKQFRNGIESVRGILFFITCFVVLVLAEAGLAWLGWIPKWGIVILGFTMNISYIINLVLIILAVLIVFGSFILPSYRLYNEFSETKLNHNYKLFGFSIKRSLQYVAGFIPGTFFATITSIPAIVLVSVTLFFTLQIKNQVIEFKIDKLATSQQKAEGQIEEYKLIKEINHFQYIQQFPGQILQEMGHRSYLKEEKQGYERNLEKLKLELTEIKSKKEALQTLGDSLNTEKIKPVVNQTRVNELQEEYHLLSIELSQRESATKVSISKAEIDQEYASRKLRQLPWVFYFSGLFLVIVSTLIFTFFFGYYGNLFYKTYLYRNDGNSAYWKLFIRSEKDLDKKQPLLSTTLNIILLLVVAYFVLKLFYIEKVAGFLIF